MYSNMAVATLVVSVVLPALATIAVALRFYVRYNNKQRIGADDYTIVVAVVSCLSFPLLSID